MEVFLIFCVLVLAALLIPWFEGLLTSKKYIGLTIFALGLAFALRALGFDYRSGDYNTFLVHWVEHFRIHGGFAGLGYRVGNYNFPYLYFLALFSYSDINDLYLIKFLSVSFDLVLAFAMMKLTGVFTQSKPKRLAVYLITLLLPTVVLNGAIWGQCDSIYAAFAVLSLWLALTDRPKLSMVCITLSFAFKLQAVFIMPLFLVLLFAKKIKFRHLFIFPIVYIITILPAVAFGRPFFDSLFFYFHNVSSAGRGLNYNSPSIFAMIRGPVNVRALSALGIVAAFTYVFIILVWAWQKRKNLSNEALAGIALLFVVGIPFLLPHMHDRYFFMADTLTLLPAVLYARYVPVPILTSFASSICYYAYLRRAFILPLQFGSIALIGVLLIVFIFTADKLNTRRYRRPG